MNTSETPDTYTLAIAAFNNMPAHFHQPGNGKALLLGISQHLRDDLVRPNVQLMEETLGNRLRRIDFSYLDIAGNLMGVRGELGKPAIIHTAWKLEHQRLPPKTWQAQVKVVDPSRLTQPEREYANAVRNHLRSIDIVAIATKEDPEPPVVQYAKSCLLQLNLDGEGMIVTQQEKLCAVAKHLHDDLGVEVEVRETGVRNTRNTTLRAVFLHIAEHDLDCFGNTGMDAIAQRLFKNYNDSAQPFQLLEGKKLRVSHLGEDQKYYTRNASLRLRLSWQQKEKEGVELEKTSAGSTHSKSTPRL